MIFIIFIYSCNIKNESQSDKPKDFKPIVSDNGETIEFIEKLNPHFATTVITKDSVKGEYLAPATIVASILKPSMPEASIIILFENEELNQLYTSYLSSIAHYKKDTDYLRRVQDMYEHQATTGAELREAETGVTDAATELAEKEGRFRMLGFDPKELQRAQPGYVWLMSDVPESVLNSLGKGQNCGIEFTSYPGEEFKGRIDALGEVLDPATRTINVRIILTNKDNKFRSGMYARVRFNLKEKNALSVPANAVVSVQGRNYIFRKNGRIVKRVPVVTESQIGNSLVVLKGIAVGDTIISEGAMLLKGLSFGY
ncbi:MAG: efflux RND transporter periplasmic adaptor subunit [Bacteroidota bacterium]|nr:efflux RND transporter periplasmic adaptor subunit [Bacteroidota bacterium]